MKNRQNFLLLLVSIKGILRLDCITDHTRNSKLPEIFFPLCYTNESKINRERDSMSSNKFKEREKLLGGAKSSAISKDVFISHENLVYK